jgi:Fur family zinc uptake transcriptional regulator
MFLICDTCQHVAERQNNLVEDLGTVIDAESGFQVQKMVFEAQGLCPSCQRVE